MLFKTITFVTTVVYLHFIKGVSNEQNSENNDSNQVYKKDDYNVYVYSGPNCKVTTNHSEELKSLRHQLKDLQKDYSELKEQQGIILKAVSSLHEAFTDHKDKQKKSIVDVISSLNDAYSEQKQAYLEHKEQQISILEAISTLKKAAYPQDNDQQEAILDAISSLSLALTGGGGRVHHIESPTGAYKYTKAEARSRCEEEGMSLATMAQLQAAFNRGMHSCRCGWLKDGMAAYPIQWPRDSCGGDKTDPGIRTCTSTSTSRYDAYCFQ